MSENISILIIVLSTCDNCATRFYSNFILFFHYYYYLGRFDDKICYKMFIGNSSLQMAFKDIRFIFVPSV